MGCFLEEEEWDVGKNLRVRPAWGDFVPGLPSCTDVHVADGTKVSSLHWFLLRSNERMLLVKP